MKIIKYNSNKDIVVEFQDKYKAKVHTGYHNFKNRTVHNPYARTVMGVGFLGEGDGIKEGDTLKKPYSIWVSMLNRCYSKVNKKNPSYGSCAVCEEWHNYRNFEKWFYENYYEIDGEDMELDKDILCKHNKMYCPQYCCFVPSNINCIFTRGEKIRGEYPIGVMWHKRDEVFEAWCCNGNKKSVYLGRFDNQYDAFYEYKKYKEKVIKDVAHKYRKLIPIRLYEGLMNYEVEITD